MEEVRIGNQIWMKYNLDVDTFRNGDPISPAQTDEEWENAAENKLPAWCNYNNGLENKEKYGKLYNFYALNDLRNLAPVGWHIPSEEEWITLINNLSEGSEFNKEIRCFSNMLGGFRGNFSNFRGIDKCSIWWSSTEIDDEEVSAVEYNLNEDCIDQCCFDKSSGLSVLCIKD
jgi:uncharacterized protein (TIGR02145 family)